MTVTKAYKEFEVDFADQLSQISSECFCNDTTFIVWAK